MRIVHFLRRPAAGSYSVERNYEDIRSHMPADLQVVTCVSRFASRGVLGRLYDVFRARRHQGHVNHVTGDVHFLTYLLNRRRTILTILDCVTLERLGGFKRWLFWLLWYFLPAKRCVAITVISEATRRQVLHHVRCDPAKIRIIYCPVSEEFSPLPGEFNTSRPQLLHIGTTRNKNLERHAAALTGLDCDLVIVGNLSDAQRTVLDRSKVCYKNHVGLSREALLDQYQRCDMVLFASTYEGFGLPIVEANAVGRPVITSNLWSMPEVAGDAACLVDPFDVGSIRAGIVRVTEDACYRAELVQRGFENVKHFRIETIAEQYAALYREVYENAGPIKAR